MPSSPWTSGPLSSPRVTLFPEAPKTFRNPYEDYHLLIYRNGKLPCHCGETFSPVRRLRSYAYCIHSRNTHPDFPSCRPYPVSFVPYTSLAFHPCQYHPMARPILNRRMEQNNWRIPLHTSASNLWDKRVQPHGEGSDVQCSISVSNNGGKENKINDLSTDFYILPVTVKALLMAASHFSAFAT